MNCLAIIAVTASMIVDGDTVRLNGPNARLTGVGDVPFDTPETHQPECGYEAEVGAEATALVQSLMPGRLCIIEREGGGYGRDLAILFGSDGEDVREPLMRAGLARASKNADWCR
ncbi:thermonuclease family protein [Roseivivax marinus]|uniref:thermonuclease family protein n=1 Tax=Roseivivax marinus TaxID=1379903 RepID=UPI00273E600A|nr:thermonuclease family protein [Roseivivax marinus]